MKTIRSLMIPAGVLVMLFTLGLTSARGQLLTFPSFQGSFTLPFEAQWGGMTLPAGDYTVHYGSLNNGGTYLVEVAGEAKGSPHGLITIKSHDRSLASKNVLICVRNGHRGIVRTMHLPAIDTTLNFSLPRGVQILAEKQKGKGYPQLARGPMLIQRIGITPAAK